MTGILQNWKTTSAGLAAICGALGDIFTALGHGTVTGNLSVDIAAIATGVGLIFAGDASASKPK